MFSIYSPVGLIMCPPMAFKGIKQQMVKATHLAHPGKNARLALSYSMSIDASGTHVGAALQQEMSPGSLQAL